ncbi:contractile injection system tape measure protein [uncultured Aquimarina sp.]|uniref:contractile injection system tape measure protein n=1 Tax=uncultured Aquimarina sp. TaxID=575652 RepID=UPI00261E39DA|nr:contractile injection system tape measure protein [uncultured Aquimarina sp.]
MTNKKHIINKVFFEVNTPDTKTAYYLKDNLDVFLKQSLLPTIQTYFDSIASVDDQIIRFDTLELSIDSKDVKDQLQLQLDIIKSLQKQLILKKGSKIPEEKDQMFLSTDKEKSDVETFLYFLKSGQKPWWNLEIDIEDKSFLAKIISSKNFEVKLRECLVHLAVRQRLIYQFSDEELLKILDKDTSNLQFPKRLKRKAVRERYWETIMKYLTDGNTKSLQRGLIVLFTELNEKSVHETLVYEIEKTFESEQILKKEIDLETKGNEQLLKLKRSLIKSLKEIVSKELKSIRKVNGSLVISERTIYDELGNDQKKYIDTRILNEILKESVGRVYQILKEAFNAFKEDIMPFTSILISKKLEDFQYDIIRNPNRKIDIKQNEIFTEKEIIEQESSLYIHNAGLLLLHPYVERLFSTLKLLNEEKKIKEEKIELAIHLLHFLATKKEKQVESNLVFEKFMCGYPIDKPIHKNVRLPQNFKEEAESLLKAVLKNWQALKNTSTDGLRENFIKREGKLMLDEPSKYRVIVARKTQDILLEKLPWNLNIIKLPWIEKLIFVEW